MNDPRRAHLIAPLAGLLLMAGCSGAARLTLSDVQTVRHIKGTRLSLMTAARAFTQKELFKISSYEEQSGRVLAFRNTSMGRQNESRMVIMHLTILPEAEDSCEVTARFVFAKDPGYMTRDEQDMLLECYRLLFDELVRGGD
ncbi:MAG: hypothetical protein AB1428_14365 [Bacteroidota bacterium]